MGVSHKSIKFPAKAKLRSNELYLLILTVSLNLIGTLGDTFSAPEEVDLSSLKLNACDLDPEFMPMYCNCDHQDPQEAVEVKCGSWGSPKDGNGPWEALGNLRNMSYLEFNNRPERALKYFPSSSLFQSAKLLTYFSSKLSQFQKIVPYAFGNSSSLSEIILIDNMIESLESKSFANLKNASKINLGSNVIKEVNRDVFSNMPKLQSLYLDKNRIQVVHDYAFKELHNLEELDLQKNNLSVVAREVFSGLGKMLRLDLQGNMIEFLGDHVFADMPLLQELDLHENQIRSVSSTAFYGLKSLGRLILKGNKIVTLPPQTFGHLGTIFLLDLRDNELDTLSEALILPIYTNLKNFSMQLMIDGNRLMCDCRILWLQELYKETESDYVKRHLEKIQCNLFTTGEQRMRDLHLHPKVAVSYSSNVTVVAAPPEETTTYAFDGSKIVIELNPTDFKCHESVSDQKDFPAFPVSHSHQHQHDQHDDATSKHSNHNENNPKEIGHRFPIVSDKDKNILQKSHHQSHVHAEGNAASSGVSGVPGDGRTFHFHPLCFYLSLFVSCCIANVWSYEIVLFHR